MITDKGIIIINLRCLLKTTALKESRILKVEWVWYLVSVKGTSSKVTVNWETCLKQLISQLQIFKLFIRGHNYSFLLFVLWHKYSLKYL